MCARDEVYSRNSSHLVSEMSPSAVKIRGEWLVLAAAVLWGTTGTSQALAPESATSLGIGAIRLAIGGVAMLAIAILNGSFSVRQPWSTHNALLGAACIAGYQVLFFSGVAAAGVAVGTVVGIGSSPLIAGALVWILYAKKPDNRWFIATALAVVGCILLAFSDGSINFDPTGILLAMGAGACYAGFVLNSQRLMAHHPPDAVMAVLFFISALMLSPLLFVVDLSWLGEIRGLAVALNLGLVTTALGNFLLGRGLQTVQPAHAVTLTLAEPLTAGLLGVFLLGEVLSPPAWVGIFLILAGLVLLSR